jgi:DNA modification methylase
VPDRELSIDEMRELNVRLNKNQGEWNFDTLANNFELDDLLDWGFEKSDLDLDLWMPDPPEDAEPQIDRAEELREIWGVETGQLWQLGEHRLICGDCTDKAVVERVMQGERADMVFTDPPYGMNLDADFELMSKRSNRVMGNKYSDVINDDKDFDPMPFIKMFSEAKEQMWWGADYYYDKLPPNGSWIVWVKRNENMTNIIGNHFEVCWSMAKHKRKVVFKAWSGVTARNPEFSREHPTEKPIELNAELIAEATVAGDLVIDLFAGVGTTLIACERLNRKCRACEISPNYVSVAIQRWVDVTGGVPELVKQ